MSFSVNKNTLKKSIGLNPTVPSAEYPNILDTTSLCQFFLTILTGDMNHLSRTQRGGTLATLSGRKEPTTHDPPPGACKISEARNVADTELEELVGGRGRNWWKGAWRKFTSKSRKFGKFWGPPLGRYLIAVVPKTWNTILSHKTIIQPIYRWYMLVYISGTLSWVPNFSLWMKQGTVNNIHRENGGGPLGWWTLNNKPHIHLI